MSKDRHLEVADTSCLAWENELPWPALVVVSSTLFGQLNMVDRCVTSYALAREDEPLSHEAVAGFAYLQLKEGEGIPKPEIPFVAVRNSLVDPMVTSSEFPGVEVWKQPTGLATRLPFEGPSTGIYVHPYTTTAMPNIFPQESVRLIPGTNFGSQIEKIKRDRYRIDPLILMPDLSKLTPDQASQVSQGMRKIDVAYTRMVLDLVENPITVVLRQPFRLDTEFNLGVSQLGLFNEIMGAPGLGSGNLVVASRGGATPGLHELLKDVGVLGDDRARLGVFLGNKDGVNDISIVNAPLARMTLAQILWTALDNPTDAYNSAMDDLGEGIQGYAGLLVELTAGDQMSLLERDELHASFVAILTSHMIECNGVRKRMKGELSTRYGD